MTHVDLDDLADLVLDPDATPDSVREHVESCPECTDRLAALFDVRRLTSGEPLVAPPARVREQVLAQVNDVPGDAPVRPVPLQVAAPPPEVARPRRRVPVWAAGLAAGVALVAGLGLGRTTLDDATTPGRDAPEAVVAAADLTALDSTAGRGVARAVESDDTITLRVQASELGGEDGFHEVWLINVDGERMVALGVLADGDAGEFQVPRGLLDEGYLVVDISVEPDDGDPTHSGVSLARGELV
ncbi:anti-sigma factor [Nocardioides zhouii]|uniref:Anti-sigma factor n=1 Tax=Nocardioides zhouii TaxID=1168729 RepID=A0A4Q2T6B1_9ACTN|nr:anti-sigma factor [Nocardioides zhouii]RYC12660.1 anti-sigma factor [Nocardioides zhouii]